MKSRFFFLLMLLFSAFVVSSQDMRTKTSLANLQTKNIPGSSIKSVNDSFPQVSSIYLEINTTHYYKSPMLGLMFERGFVDEKTRLTFITKVGAWVYPIKKENNFFVAQVGAFKTLKNNKTDIGFYLIDFNGHAFPRPSYETPWDSMQKNTSARPKDQYGYNSPFSAFVTFRPFKDNRNTNSLKNPGNFEFTTKVSYFTNYKIINEVSKMNNGGNKLIGPMGIMFSIRYKLYGATKKIAPTPYTR